MRTEWVVSLNQRQRQHQSQHQDQHQNEASRHGLHVLMVAKDPSLFDPGTGVAADTRRRHQRYARAIRERFGAVSSLRIICYTLRSDRRRVEHLADNLSLYPTCSRHRSLFLAGVIRLLPVVLRGWRPDVITPQTPWEEGPVCFMLARALGARFLPQLHFDLFSTEWRGESWLNGWRQTLARELLAGADGVRVVSTSLGNKLEREVGVRRDRVHVAPVGVRFDPVDDGNDGDDFRRRISPDLVDRPVVLFVGRFYAPKDLPRWIGVARRIADAVDDVRFVMAGDGEERATVEATITRHGLEDRFHLLGAVGHRRLPEVYAAADVFLLTSSHESFGRVIVEAFLSGLPVVSTDCSGPRELVRHGVNGFLHSYGDDAGLAASVVRLLGDGSAARAMGARGREATASECDFDRQVARLVDCWGDRRRVGAGVGVNHA